MLGLEPVDFEWNGYKGAQAPTEEQEVEPEVVAPNLHCELRADEAKIAAKLHQEGARLAQQAVVQVGLGLAGLQVEELD